MNELQWKIQELFIYPTKKAHDFPNGYNRALGDVIKLIRKMELKNAKSNSPQE